MKKQKRFLDQSDTPAKANCDGPVLKVPKDNTTGWADYKSGQTNETMEYPFVGSWWTEENPTNQLRWVMVASSDKPHKHDKVLQQKWQIVHIKNGIVEYVEHEWRDVPEGGEQ